MALCITSIQIIEPSDSGAGLTSRTTGVDYGGPPDTGQSLSGDCLISGCQPSNRPIQRPTGSSHAHFASDLEAATSVGKHLASYSDFRNCNAKPLTTKGDGAGAGPTGRIQNL